MLSVLPGSQTPPSDYDCGDLRDGSNDVDDLFADVPVTPISQGTWDKIKATCVPGMTQEHGNSSHGIGVHRLRPEVY